MFSELVGTVAPLSQSLICIDPMVIYQKLHRLESPKVLRNLKWPRNLRKLEARDCARRSVHYPDQLCMHAEQVWLVCFAKRCK
jgi:hypothetical protein